MGNCILIVDDEEMIRQGIRARLDYLGFKFDVIREAGDGKPALSILDQEKIDIVITDIRMTDMDGLEFIKEAKFLHPHIEFIILSGYTEFAYAKQAIVLGVNAYLLKPISNDQLKEAMKDVLEKLSKKVRQKEMLQLSRGILKDNDQYIVEKDINALLNYSEPLKAKEAVLTRSIDEYFPIKDKKLMTLIINIDEESYNQSKFHYNDINVIRFSVKNIFNEFSIKSKKIIVNNLSNTNQLFAIVSNTNQTMLRVEVEQLLSKTQSILWGKMGISSTVGISSITDVVSREGTQQAQEALRQRLIHGKGNIYFYEDIKLLSNSDLPAEELKMLSQYIERSDISNIQEMIMTIFSDERIHRYNVNYIRMIWVRITGILLRHGNINFEKNPQAAEKLVVDLDNLVGMTSADEIREYFWMLILDCLEVDKSLDIPAKDKMKLAIKYISDNYNEDMSINELAERYTMSPNYFSTLFKKETGQTAVNYIKELRIKRAKEYLALSDRSVVDIAKEVGYEDGQYFSKVFKKETDQTPLEYRRSQV